MPTDGAIALESSTSTSAALLAPAAQPLAQPAQPLDAAHVFETLLTSAFG